MSPPRKALASATKAVKGLRSQSLAPMNSANHKTVCVALDCLLATAQSYVRGACAPV